MLAHLEKKQLQQVRSWLILEFRETNQELSFLWNQNDVSRDIFLETSLLGFHEDCLIRKKRMRAKKKKN